MSDNPCLATIRGLPHIPSITEINVRSGPGTNFKIAFKGQVGLANLSIQEVQPDDEGKGLQGKVYQWFKLSFPDSGDGWVRDDLLALQGECADWGYESLQPDTFAFALTRTYEKTTDEKAPAEESTPVVTEPAPELLKKSSSTGQNIQVDSSDQINRIKSASFAVTAAFEGNGHDAYNNYDNGIVSYGLLQFTLASGSLFSVVDRYLASSTSSTANSLRAYSDRIRDRLEELREDGDLKNLLLAAAQEEEMREAQDYVATVNYWDKVVTGYITHRKMKLPLTYALLFDMGVNFGTGHRFVRLAEEQLGVPLRSIPGENGITEEQLITKVAELRRDSHYKQAERDNLPGLRLRGDFWIDRINQGDWDFVGGDTGEVSVLGKIIQIANP